ncbi:MAG: hypothetical protein LBV41_03780 [Cytophagaceae bacterium]|jgi:hypothetical protein|nr:hypothetical protein [Cytophagaceae bacterium]
MRTDTIIRNEGTQALMDKLGLVDAERFIMLIQKEHFDYTRWQENLFENMSIDEISQNAAELRENNRVSISSEM